MRFDGRAFVSRVKDFELVLSFEPRPSSIVDIPRVITYMISVEKLSTAHTAKVCYVECWLAKSEGCGERGDVRFLRRARCTRGQQQTLVGCPRWTYFGVGKRLSWEAI